MKSRKTSGITLAKSPEADKYIWSEPDFPCGKISRKISVSGTPDDLMLHYIVTKYCEVSHIYRFPVSKNKADGSYELQPEIMRMLLMAAMEEYTGPNPDAKFDETFEFARSHPVSGGISMEIGGQKAELCSELTNEDIKELVLTELEDIEMQGIMRNLPELIRNDEDSVRFLCVENPSIKEKLGRRHSIDVIDDMDLVIEARVKYRGASKGELHYPLRMFHLSKAPRFDYESRSLTGVGKCYNADGDPVCHKDIWAAQAVMTRLPPEDIDYDDARHCVGMALVDICKDGPEPDF